MPEENEPQVKKTPNVFWKSLTWTEIGAIAVFIGYIIYLNISTGLVLNYNNSTETRVINGIPNPPNTALYAANSYVPKSNVSNTQTVVGIFLFLVVIMVLLAKRISTPRRATAKEAMDDLSKQFKELKNVTLADGTTVVITDDIDVKITSQFLTRYRSVGNERKEFRYPFLVMVFDKFNHVEYYFKAYYHPWTRYWDGFVETTKALSEQDTCPNCGSEYDEKWILAEDYKKFREIMKSIRR